MFTAICSSVSSPDAEIMTPTVLVCAFSLPLPNLFLPHMLVPAVLLIRLHLGIENVHARLYRFFHDCAFERLASVDANVPLSFRGRQE
jgi:hypothetical protein